MLTLHHRNDPDFVAKHPSPETYLYDLLSPMSEQAAIKAADMFIESLRERHATSGYEHRRIRVCGIRADWAVLVIDSSIDDSLAMHASGVLPQPEQRRTKDNGLPAFCECLEDSAIPAFAHSAMRV